jgi:7-cyano-7-deazaguanine synthase
MSETTGVLLSGGLDSSILLGHLLHEGHRVQPFYVRGHLIWEGEELAAVRRFLKALATPRLRPLVVLDMPVADLYEDHWSTTGRGTPNAESPDDAVYLPGRNALLLVKPVLWCQMHGIRQLAAGVLGSNPFHDATDEFFEQFQSALSLAGGAAVRILRPFAARGKNEVMELGRGLPLEATFSCIAPIGGVHCGRCNKCAERQEAFQRAGITDPTRYIASAVVKS